MTLITEPLSNIKSVYIYVTRNGYDYGSSATCRMMSPHPLQRHSAIYRQETLLPGYRCTRHTELEIGSSRAARDMRKLTL